MPPTGIEPVPTVPETVILSVELRGRVSMMDFLNSPCFNDDYNPIASCKLPHFCDNIHWKYENSLLVVKIYQLANSELSLILEMNKSIVLALYQKPQTVFTLQEITLFFPQIPYNNIKKRLSYYAQTGSLRQLHRGIYAKANYNPLELANKLYSPSYISLETVLQRAGVTFQYYQQAYAVSYLSRTMEVDGQTIIYRRLPKEVLLNNQGVVVADQVVMASPERAWLDAVYLYKNYHFDNLGGLNWDKIMELKTLYLSQSLLRRVEQYHQISQEEDA